MRVRSKCRAVMLAVTVIAGTAATGLAVNAASANVAAPGISKASCSSAWLRLWGSNSESCYSGNGSLVVHLPGVGREQITGHHEVCLSGVASVVCTTGPGTFLMSRPLLVKEITIRSV